MKSFEYARARSVDGAVRLAAGDSRVLAGGIDLLGEMKGSVATLGGNLAQHSRCWYYRHRDLRCLKRGGSHCYAREGENKYHSLFSGNPCISPVVSNLAVMLAALGATVIIRRGDQEI